MGQFCITQKRMVPPLIFYSTIQSNPSGKALYFDCWDLTAESRCECDTRTCNGDATFCLNVTCFEGSPCTCETETGYTTARVQISETETTIDPVIFSFKTCIYQRPQTTNSRTRRHLLSEELATFHTNEGTIIFTDPIFTADIPGLMIIHKDGDEITHAFTLQSKQFSVPARLRYDSGMLEFKFVALNGSLLEGSVHVKGLTRCQRITCLICMDIFYHLTCLPPIAQYIIYAFTAALSLIVITYLRLICRTLCSLIRCGASCLIISLRILKALPKFVMRLGAITGLTTKTTLQNIKSRVQDSPLLAQANRPPTPTSNQLRYSLVLLALMIPLLTLGCNEHTIIHSNVHSCRDLHDAKTCQISANIQLSLNTLQATTCLWLQDENGSNIYHIQLQYLRAECHWDLERLYYTFPVETRVTGEVVCPQNAYCSWGLHCKQGNSNFPGRLKESIFWPGRTHCMGADNSMCTIIHAQPCFFYRWYLVGQYNQTYEVHRITGAICNPIIQVTEIINNTATEFVTSSTSITKSGIKVTVLGNYDQPSIQILDSFVRNIDDPQEAYLARSSPQNQVVTGTLGDIQSPTPFSKEFIFPHDFVLCHSYEERISCDSQESYVHTLTKTKSHILPKVHGNHKFLVDQSGTLKSQLLQSSPAIVHMVIKNMSVTVRTIQVCPQITSNLGVQGCHSCSVPAKFKITAKSTCQDGRVDVSLVDIPLSTRSVYLSTTDAPITIEFKTAKPCHQETLCLVFNELRSCETFQFCLDDPELELFQRNISTATDSGIATSPSFWETVKISSTNFFSSMRKTLYYLAIILAAIFAFSLIITLLKR